MRANVSRLVVEINGRGAISQIVFNRELPAGSRINLTGPTQTQPRFGVYLPGHGFAVDRCPAVARQMGGDGRIDILNGDPSNVMHTFADGVDSRRYMRRRAMQRQYLSGQLAAVDVANVVQC